MNLVPAVAYHFCLALPAAFTQPGAHLLAEPCTLASEDDEARNGGGSNDGGDAAKKHFSETHDDQENSISPSLLLSFRTKRNEFRSSSSDLILLSFFLSSILSDLMPRLARLRRRRHNQFNSTGSLLYIPMRGGNGIGGRQDIQCGPKGLYPTSRLILEYELYFIRRFSTLKGYFQASL